MSETFKNILAAVFVSISLVVVAAIVPPSITHAQDLNKAVDCGSNIDFNTGGDCSVEDKINKCKADAGDAAAKAACEPTNKVENTIKTIINVFAAIVGSVCVIMIIIGGFRYVTSGGDSNNVSAAKNTILYALVGLVIVALARIIVQFILQRVV